MKATRLLKAVLLLAPVAVLAALSLAHYLNLRNGVEWRVPVTGYDPRDLLRGHFLQFRYQWNLDRAAAPTSCIGADCALCADAPAEFNPLVTLLPLDQVAACTSYIAGAADLNGAFTIRAANAGVQDLTRYYVAEQHAERLQRLLLDGTGPPLQFAIGLRVSANGQAYIENLYVDSMPLQQWLATH